MKGVGKFMNSLKNYGGFGRSLPKGEALNNNPDLGRYLKGILASGISIDSLKDNPALNSCYKNGWLQAELVPDPSMCRSNSPSESDIEHNRDKARRVYIFPSHLHEK